MATLSLRVLAGLAVLVAPDYQKSLQQNLSEGVLRYYQIQATRDLASAPSSKLVFLGPTGKLPETWLDLRSGKNDNPY